MQFTLMLEENVFVASGIDKRGQRGWGEGKIWIVEDKVEVLDDAD